MKKLILAVPLLLVLSVMSAIVFLLQKYFWGGLAVLVFALALNWWSETFALHLFREKKRKYDFRILTYNVNRAHETSTNKGTTEELIAFILEQDADIVLLQEYNAELYPLVLEQLSKEYLYGSGIDATSRFKSVFSRFPIESCEQLMVDSRNPEYEVFQNAIYCKKQYNGMEIMPICKLLLNINGHKVQVFNCHLMSNNYSVVIRNLRRKGVFICKGLLPILARVDFGYKARELQTRVIKERVDRNDPTLICGDFNDVGGSSPIRILQSLGIKDAWWNRGFGFGFTYHGYGLKFRLDHVLYTPTKIELVNINIPNLFFSDHNAIVCDFMFPRYI